MQITDCQQINDIQMQMQKRMCNYSRWHRYFWKLQASNPKVFTISNAKKCQCGSKFFPFCRCLGLQKAIANAIIKRYITMDKRRNHYFYQFRPNINNHTIQHYVNHANLPIQMQNHRKSKPQRSQQLRSNLMMNMTSSWILNHNLHHEHIHPLNPHVHQLYLLPVYLLKFRYYHKI